MRVLVVDYAGHPFQYELSCALGARGHHVVHTFSSSTLNARSGFEPSDNVIVESVDIGHEFERYRVLRRLRDEVQYGWRTARLARRVRPDRLLTSNVPLVSLLLLGTWATVTRTRWVLWLQDIQSGLGRIVTGRDGLVSRAMRVLEIGLVRLADHVVAISEGFADELREMHVADDRVTVIENWAPIESIPTRPADNPWSAAQGLHDRFVFLYSGTLAKKHSPEHLLALARHFEFDSTVVVAVVGGGTGAEWLEAQHHPTIRVLPYQPFEVLPDVLGSADVLVVLLDPGAGQFSVPSKTLSYLCAGRAVLAALPDDNAAARLVHRASAGIVTDPQDMESFLLAADRLKSGSQELARFGRAARAHAEAHFTPAHWEDPFVAALRLTDDGRVRADLSAATETETRRLDSTSTSTRSGWISPT